jgi:hypothetical protein
VYSYSLAYVDMRRVHGAAKLTPVYVCKMGIVASSLRFIARPFAALAGKKPTLTPYGELIPNFVQHVCQADGSNP